MKRALFVANLRSLDCSDIPSLKAYRPEGPCGIYIEAIVGPAGEPGGEIFGFTLCTPEWFAQEMKDTFVPGRHYLFVREYDYAALERYVRGYCQKCTGLSWNEVAEKVSHLGHWEYENYKP